MKGIYSLLICCVIVGGAWGQAQKPAKMIPGTIECKTCHTIDTPTKQNLSLVECPRAMVEGYHSVEEAPQAFTMDEFTDKYGPVKFSHKAHAEMAEMGGGCAVCHHYNQARPIQECGECHSASRIRADLGKPDLKGARHRLCVDCHLRWSHAAECDSCHAKNTGETGAKVAEEKKFFPQVTIPKRMVYEVDSVKGRFVTFFHNDHAERLGLKCTDCHQQQSCASCHDLKKTAQGSQATPVRQAKKTGSMEEVHKSCFSCHANARCATCHMGKPMESFVRKKFGHEKTGLVLDEAHGALECNICHSDKNFVTRPSCVACHQDKSYPRDKPGKIVVTAVKKK